MIYTTVLDKKFESQFEGIVAYIYELAASGGDSAAGQWSKKFGRYRSLNGAKPESHTMGNELKLAQWRNFL